MVDLLKTHGFPAVAIELPSTTNRSPRDPATMGEDATAIKTAAEALLGLGREVVVSFSAPPSRIRKNFEVVQALISVT